MAVKTKDELMNIVKQRIGDSSEDSDLAFLEDFEDTLSDMENRVAESGDWKQKYEQNDASWRKRYKDRFFNEGGEDPHEGEDLPPKRLTFEDLFKKGE